MDDDLKPRSIKIGEERWQRWQVAAKARGVSLTAMIIERVETPTLADDMLTKADVAKDAEIAALQTDVASLKRDLAKRPLAVERHHLNEVTRPSMTRIDPAAPANPASEKEVAKILPLTGDQFPRQLTWAQKKQLAASKGKGKRP